MLFGGVHLFTISVCLLNILVKPVYCYCNYGSPHYLQDCRCGPLPFVADGEFQTTQDGSNGRVLTCRQGFTLKGPSIIRCDGQKWSPHGKCFFNGPFSNAKNEPQSPKNSCLEIPSVLNGLVVQGSNEGETVRNIHCHEGFYLRGEDAVVCLDNGQWSYRGLCVKDCGAVPSFANGYVKPGSCAFGSKLEVGCTKGRLVNGTGFITCLQNGKWSHPGTCSLEASRKCKVEPPKIQNGQITDDPGSKDVGSVLRFICDSGFTLRGTDEIRCEETGLWERQGYCRRDRQGCRLPPPKIPNGRVEAGSKEIGSLRQITCINNLFKISGPDYVECLSNGKWSNTGICVLVVCKVLPVLENGIYLGKGSRTGSKRFVFCNPGYLINGADQISCSASGTWGMPGKCIPDERTCCQRTPKLNAWALLATARSGDIAGLREGLENSVDPNFKDDNGFSPLMLAVRSNCLECMAALINCCADVNDRANNNKTALLMAVESGSDCAVEILLASGADPDARSDDGETALMLAAERGLANITGLLLLRNADFNAWDKGGRNALMIAAINNHTDLAKDIYLFTNGTLSLPQRTNDNPTTALSATTSTKTSSRKAITLTQPTPIALPQTIVASTRKTRPSTSYVTKSTAVATTETSGPTGSCCQHSSKMLSFDLVTAARDGNFKAVSEALFAKNADPNSIDADRWTALMHAAFTEQPHVVRVLLSCCADVEAKDSAGATALVLAAAGGSQQSAKLLLQHGADPNAHDNFQQTALLFAAENGYLNITDDLLKFGVYIDKPNVDGRTPLMLAVSGTYRRIVEKLIEAGARLNEQDIDGATALMFAMRSGDTAIVKILLDAGADPEIRDNAGNTAVDYGSKPERRFSASTRKVATSSTKITTEAYTLEYWMTTTSVMKQSCCDSSTKRQSSVLIEAARICDKSTLIEELSSKLADPNSRDENQWTALMHSAVGGHVDCLTILLDCCSRIGARNKDGETSLFLAVKNGKPDVVRYLISRNANVSTPDNTGLTPLLLASTKGLPKTIQILLENGANIRDIDSNGRNALHLAVIGNSSSSVTKLLSFGVDVNQLDLQSNSPLALAMASGLGEISEILIKAGASHPTATTATSTAVDDYQRTRRKTTSKSQTTTTIQEPVSESSVIACCDSSLMKVQSQRLIDSAKLCDSIKMADELNRKTADPNSIDKNRWTALMHSAAGGYVDCLDALLKCCARLDIKNNHGDTALLVAVKNAKFEAVRLLLSKGANVTARDNIGTTPLLAAAEKGLTKSVELLLQSGADVYATDQDGYSPLHLAVMGNRSDTVRKLLSHGSKVQQTDSRGETALVEAARRGLADIYDLLVGAGADTSSTDRNGVTAARLLERQKSSVDSTADQPTARGSAEPSTATMVKTTTPLPLTVTYRPATATPLSNSGSSCCQPGQRKGYSRSLLRAAKNGDFSTLLDELTVKRADPDTRDDQRWTALMFASVGGCEDCLNALFACCANIEAKNTAGETALILAVKAAKKEAVSLLLANHAKTDASDITGLTPLLAASQKGLSIIVQMLMENGADASLADKYGFTALHWAVMEHNLETVNKLLSFRVNTEQKDLVGETALMKSVKRGFVDIFNVLVKAGADIRAVDSRGRSVAMMAQDSGNPDIQMFFAKELPTSTTTPRPPRLDYGEVAEYG